MGLLYDARSDRLYSLELKTIERFHGNKQNPVRGELARCRAFTLTILKAEMNGNVFLQRVVKL